MKLSQNGVNFIKSHEALRLKAYQDSKGVWTIGWGHTKGVKRGQVITRADAERFIRDDLAPIERHLTADLGEDGVLQCQFDALCSWIFNLRDGIRQYNTSTLRRWCVGEFGIDTNAVRKWEKTGRIPPYARQKLVMRWTERFHDIEFAPEAS